MNLLTRGVLILLCFELGILLVLVPWTPFWSGNQFLIRYPELIPILLNNYVRGAVSGLGIADIMIALSLFGRMSRRGAKDDAEPA